MVLTRKRLLLIGFILVLLIGIPATLFVVQQQQELRSRAEKSTTLYFQPESTQAQPLVYNADETFSLDLYANPGTNLISSVRLEILYDPTKLATASAGAGEAAFVPDQETMPNIITGPIYTSGKIFVLLNVGADATNVVDTVSKIGTITFTALEETTGVVTQVSYGPQSLITSAGDESQAAENVLSTTNPAFITILGEGAPTPTPTDVPDPEEPTETPTPTDEPEVIEGPQGEQGPQGPQGEPGEVVVATATPVLTLAPTATTAPIAAAQPTATPTLAPSGPGDTVLGFGFAVTALTIIGGILFFVL